MPGSANQPLPSPEPSALRQRICTADRLTRSRTSAGISRGMFFGDSANPAMTFDGFVDAVGVAGVVGAGPFLVSGEVATGSSARIGSLRLSFGVDAID